MAVGIPLSEPPREMSETSDSLAGLVSLIKRLELREDDVAERRLRRIDLDLALWDALWAIDQRPDRGVSDLAEATHQNQAAFRDLSNALVERGLVTLSKSSESEVRFQLTRQGEQALRRGLEVVKGVIGDYVTDLPAADRDRLSSVLNGLLRE